MALTSGGSFNLASAGDFEPLLGGRFGLHLGHFATPLFSPRRACSTPRLLFEKASVLQKTGTLFYFRTDQVRKAYETATACPAGRFERGLIGLKVRKRNA
jgi:hypothetical protein